MRFREIAFTTLGIVIAFVAISALLIGLIAWARSTPDLCCTTTPPTSTSAP